VDYVCDAYAAGATPNPCVRCNRKVKFGALLDAALGLGADLMATGHYARVRRRGAEYQLVKAVDLQKDQSYMLHLLGQAELGRVLFPLGARPKTEVRALAGRFGLPAAAQADSQDWCYLRGGDYRTLLLQKRPDTLRPGPIIDTEGKVVGQHRGVSLYTVGQRRGLGIASTVPLYVVRIDAPRNSLVVGCKAALQSTALTATNVHFVSGTVSHHGEDVMARIRYSAPDSPATLHTLPNRTARVVFRAPQLAIAPGQSVVFYQRQVVLGGGTIASTDVEV
jgi:tRNA-specific 2-thiouridylase